MAQALLPRNFTLLCNKLECFLQDDVIVKKHQIVPYVPSLYSTKSKVFANDKQPSLLHLKCSKKDQW
jgi:hypothetical protein